MKKIYLIMAVACLTFALFSCDRIKDPNNNKNSNMTKFDKLIDGYEGCILFKTNSVHRNGENIYAAMIPFTGSHETGRVIAFTAPKNNLNASITWLHYFNYQLTGDVLVCDNWHNYTRGYSQKATKQEKFYFELKEEDNGIVLIGHAPYNNHWYKDEKLFVKQKSATWLYNRLKDKLW